MDKSLFKQYAALDLQLKQLEEQKKTLRETIIKQFGDAGIKKVGFDFGKFTIAYRTSYAYSEAVKKIETRLKLAKVREEEKGIAQKTETQYLVYTQIKI